MKKILLSVALVCAAMCAAKAEVIAKDTVAYTGAWKMDRLATTNSYGEVSVRYVCYLIDIVNKNGEPRRVPTDRATYESDDVTHIVLNVYDSGSKRIAKVININAQKEEKKQ